MNRLNLMALPHGCKKTTLIGIPLVLLMRAITL